MKFWQKPNLIQVKTAGTVNMPMKQYSEEEQRAALPLIDSKLAYTFDELKIPNNMQTHLAKGGIRTLGRLVLLADDIAGMRTAMVDLFGMDPKILEERNLISDVIEA